MIDFHYIRESPKANARPHSSSSTSCGGDLEEKQQDILQRIQGISKVDQVGLSQEFFFKLIDSMDAQRF